MPYLKHKDSGDVYPYNSDLAMRGDMIPCNANGVEDAPLEVLNDPSNGQTASATKKKKSPVVSSEFSTESVGVF